MIDSNGIGSRVVEARKLAGLSQAQMSKDIPLSVSSVSYIENGKRLPSLEQLDRIVALTGASLEWIVYGETKGGVK